jgi:tetratricopeptide (TPR) repeat protein
MLAEGCLTNADGTPKTVRAFTDPVRLGVHEAATLARQGDDSAAGQAPVYVPREVDDELRQRLSAAGFVLVTGPSTAGKSRTAYEALQAAVPGHRIIAPDSKKYLPAAIARFEQERRCVLWLDDLERFTGPDGLTRAAIGRVLDGRGHHRLIMATMRDGELERHAPDDAGADKLARELQRSVRDVIEQAWKTEVRSAFTAAELARAHDSHDPRIAQALAHVGEYEVTQYLAAAPRLLRAWKSGWAYYPRGAALVAAAVDCRRAGLTGPLPRRLLEELHGLYLDRHPRSRTRLETLEAAWDWATAPPDGASVPLLRSVGQSGYTVFDYLVDSAQRHLTAADLIPRQVLANALRYADPAEAQSIGWTAKYQDCDDVMLQAFRQAYSALVDSMGGEHPEILRIRANLAEAEYACGRFEEAEARFHATIHSCERVLGARDRLTLAARILLCYLLTDSGKLSEAETEYQSVLGVLHGDDGLEGSTRNGLAILYTSLGRYPEAEEEFTQVIADSEARYGHNDIATLTSRCYRALVLERMDRLDEAQAEQEAVLAALEVTWGSEHTVTLQSRSNLAAVMHKQGRLEESRQAYARVLDIRNRILGAEHIATLGGHAGLAAVLAEQGRLTEAVAAYRFLAKVYPRKFGELHPETIHIRRELAEILQRIGRSKEAGKQRELIRRAGEKNGRLRPTWKPGKGHSPLNRHKQLRQTKI